jgi:RNA polymerase sigma-70 factor (ECF subfamily)
MSNLFGQFIEGSEDAFGIYYKRYNGNVYATLKKLCGDEAQAKDLTQEVFRKVWDSRRRFTDEDHLRNYLFRMTRCVFLMHRREQKKATAMEKDLRRMTAEIDDSEELVAMQKQVYAAVKDAMMKLPPQQKMVIELLMQGGLDVKAVAERLRLAPQTVRNHKAQALIFLRNELCGGGGKIFFPVLVGYLLSCILL